MKFKSIILTAVLSFALVGCFDSKDDVKEPGANTSIQKTNSPEIAVRDYIQKETTHFSTGKETNVLSDKVFVFFDPQCPHCSSLWKNFQDEKVKDVNVVWIPVSVLGSKSEHQAGIMLSAKDPVALFNEHEQLMSQLKYEEADTAFAKYGENISKEVVDKLNKNNKIFDETGATGVPLVLKLSKDGKNIIGAPGELSVQLITDLMKEQNEFSPEKIKETLKK